MRAVEKGIWLKGPVCPAVEDKIQMLGDQGPVFFDSGFDVDNGSMPRISGHELFVVVHHQLYRTSGLFRQQINDGEIHKIALAAEVAADIHGIKDKFFLW